MPVSQQDQDFSFIVKELSQDNQAFSGKTIWLCGSAGFLGSLFQVYFEYLNKFVLEKPCRVVCLDNYIVGGYRNTPEIEGFEYISFDICRQIPPDIAVKYPNFIINCAGLASPNSYKTRPVETINVSVIGTTNLLDYAASHKCVQSYLAFSSSEVYGNPDVVPTPESYVGRIPSMTERSAYDLGKSVIETLCYFYNKKYGVNTQILRPHNIFGKTRNDGRVIPNMFDQILNGGKIKVFGDGSQTRTFCWFSDLIGGAIKVLLHGDSMPYNIGSDINEISMKELAIKIEKICGGFNVVDFVEKPSVYQTEPLRRCPDLTRIRSIGYDPKINLDDGLERFHEWRKNESTP